MASAKREAELEQHLASMSHEADAAAESKALLEALSDRQEAAQSALAVSMPSMPYP